MQNVCEVLSLVPRNHKLHTLAEEDGRDECEQSVAIVQVVERLFVYLSIRIWQHCTSFSYSKILAVCVCRVPNG